MDDLQFMKDMKEYKYWDNVFSFEGCVSVQRLGDSVIPWRIDCNYKDLYPVLNEEKAKQPSGVRLEFVTDSQRVVLKLSDPESGLKMDVYVNGDFKESIEIENNSIAAVIEDLPSGFNLIQIWLDPNHSICLESIYINKNSDIYKNQNNLKRWIHYGSSISHSREAKSPSMTWTGIVARKLGLHLTNLGFHSECKCDPMIALMISDLPADIITLKVGINLVDGDLNRRSFKPAVLGMAKIIREKHPDTPIVLCSPVYTPLYDDIRGGSGYNLKEMRQVISECVDILKSYGDSNIYYVSGLRLFGEDEIDHMPDKLHPDAEGQNILASNFIQEVFVNLNLLKVSN